MYTLNVEYVFYLLVLVNGAFLIWRMAQTAAPPGSLGPELRDPREVEIPFKAQIVIAAILLVVGGLVAFGVLKGWHMVYLPEGLFPQHNR